MAIYQTDFNGKGGLITNRPWEDIPPTHDKQDRSLQQDSDATSVELGYDEIEAAHEKVVAALEKGEEVAKLAGSTVVEKLAS